MSLVSRSLEDCLTDSKKIQFVAISAGEISNCRLNSDCKTFRHPQTMLVSKRFSEKMDPGHCDCEGCPKYEP